MGQAESGPIRKVFITERGAEIFSQFRPPFHSARNFKVLKQLLVCFLLPSWKPIGMAAMNVHCAFVKGALQRNMASIPIFTFMCL
jgi:hypothetical protein